MSAPNERELDQPPHTLAHPLDLALRLGLKPYSQFEENMSPVFERLTDRDRELFLRDIYRFAAEKLLREKAKKDAERQAAWFAKQSEQMQLTISILEAALHNLLVAASTWPDVPGDVEVREIVGRLDRIIGQFKSKQAQLMRLGTTLQNVEGKDIQMWAAPDSSLQYAIELREIQEIAPDSPNAEQLKDSYIRAILKLGEQANYRFRFQTEGRPLTVNDHWLIHTIDEYLPAPQAGKRSPFNRDRVICAVFEAAFGDVMRGQQGVKSARRRYPNA